MMLLASISIRAFVNVFRQIDAVISDAVRRCNFGLGTHVCVAQIGSGPQPG